MREPHSIPFLPDRLNAEPVVYRGLTAPELGLLAGVSIAVWLPVALIVSGLLGYFMMGFGIAALLALATVWCASRWVQVLKRGKPQGYHVLWAEVALHDLGFRRAPYVRHTGVWDIRRKRPIVPGLSVGHS